MSYPGAKGAAGVWQRIIGQMPPHKLYVEPFFGSGQVFYRKRAADWNILNDLDSTVDYKANLGPLGVAQNRLRILHLDALTWLSSFRVDSFLPSAILIYCDPPYLLSTRAGRRYYRHELSDAQHAELLTILCGLKCNVLVSHPPCPLYNERLKDWRCIRYQVITRGALAGTGKGKKPDALWCNFPEPDQLHDWRFAGQNFRARCWYNRCRRRILAKLAAMSPRKRGFILNAIREQYPD